MASSASQVRDPQARLRVDPIAMEGQAGKLVNRFLRSCGLAGHNSRQATQDKASARTGAGSAAGALDDCLECPVCWEGFNGGMHTPYVLFCGHTLCRSCLMGLQWATIKIPSLHIQLPLLISCPWCQFLTLRLYWKAGRLKCPSKNFFLLSLVESVKGSSAASSREQDRAQAEEGHDHAESGSRLEKVGRRLSELWRIGFSLEQRQNWSAVMDALGRGDWSRNQMLKLFGLVLQFIAKLPLVCLLLFLVLYVLPFSALVLVLYCLITLVVAVPAYLVLYFSYPSLQWLAQEIAAA